ncbi:uncharacterized protein LOC124647361 [Lolium rigidum]|uniref:uncharacterized protein LOC124647361 n=1 Tax=Lolium rigidum TaxID=89674 RepID=UPI001F5DFC03|nr:uncharacterized protein LOC124647361 [Lolium rigidum]
MHSLLGVPDFLHLYLKLHYFVVVFTEDRVCEISRLRRVGYRKGEGEHVMTCKFGVFYFCLRGFPIVRCSEKDLCGCLSQPIAKTGSTFLEPVHKGQGNCDSRLQLPSRKSHF